MINIILLGVIVFFLGILLGMIIPNPQRKYFLRVLCYNISYRLKNKKKSKALWKEQLEAVERIEEFINEITYPYYDPARDDSIGVVYPNRIKRTPTIYPDNCEIPITFIVEKIKKYKRAYRLIIDRVEQRKTTEPELDLASRCQYIVRALEVIIEDHLKTI